MAAAAAAAGTMEHSPAAMVYTLYVGDVASTVIESQIIDLYSQFHGFVSASLCRNDSPVTGTTRHYAYVNFQTLPQAKEAMEATNHRVINGKAIRVMESQSNWDSHNSSAGNIFVKNLHDSIDNAKLEEMFCKYGKILSCKVMVTGEGESKGYGFVQFESPESASQAIESANDTVVEGKTLYVSMFKRKEERFAQANPDEYHNLYFKNLDEKVAEDALRQKFFEFGEITSFLVAKDDNGKSKGFGFVNFVESKAACQARESMDGSLLGTKTLYVARAQTKVERQQFLQNEWKQKNKKCNLYVKNINDDVDDDLLKYHFSRAGRVVTAKIMRTEKGINRGFGFVCFSNPNEASNSVAILNGSMFHGKPLYVAIAQSKDERREMILKSIHANRQSAPLLPMPQSPFAFRPFFHPSSIPFPAQFPVMPGFQIRPPMMMSNFIPPMGFPAPRGRFNNVAPFPRQPPFVIMPKNRPATRDWSSDLAAASPEHRKEMIWDRLFPLVQTLKGDAAERITRTLMEMDNAELLVLLESPTSLAEKVDEAEKVFAI